MKYIKFPAITALFILFSLSSLRAQECTFNGYNDGPLHAQQGWWSDRQDVSAGNFIVVDHLGITQTMGDKALVISGAENYMKIYRNKSAVTWRPGDTAVFQMDFQIGLNGGHVDEAKNGIAILFGEQSLNVSNRWVYSLGISPTGDWLIRGNLPHWENVPKLPAETFVVRPAEGSSAVSSWYHMKLTALKDTTPNVFKVNLTLSDSDGNVVLKHAFKDAALEGDKASLWRGDHLLYGFSAKDDINGLVCVDNVNLSVIEGERKVTSLKDLL
ncbi:hypothetical protein P4B35_19580 [Pontiellaceae bacterium B12227]|nr:hypothetical protein [Pontiellaceae bacterium B12227]